MCHWLFSLSTHMHSPSLKTGTFLAHAKFDFAGVKILLCHSSQYVECNYELGVHLGGIIPLEPNKGELMRVN